MRFAGSHWSDVFFEGDRSIRMVSGSQPYSMPRTQGTERPWTPASCVGDLFNVER